MMSNKGRSYSEFRKWTEEEAERVVDFLREKNPALLKKIEEVERTTRDLRGLEEGEGLHRAMLEVYPEIDRQDLAGLLLPVRRRIWARLGL